MNNMILANCNVMLRLVSYLLVNEQYFYQICNNAKDVKYIYLSIDERNHI